MHYFSFFFLKLYHFGVLTVDGGNNIDFYFIFTDVCNKRKCETSESWTALILNWIMRASQAKLSSIKAEPNLQRRRWGHKKKIRRGFSVADLDLDV